MSAYGCCGEYNEHAEGCITIRYADLKVKYQEALDSAKEYKHEAYVRQKMIKQLETALECAEDMRDKSDAKLADAINSLQDIPIVHEQPKAEPEAPKEFWIKI